MRTGEGTSSATTWPVLLAGGDGVRLRELTRLASGRPVPKQYCSLEGPTSLLRLGLARARRFAPPERTLAVLAAARRLASVYAGLESLDFSRHLLERATARLLVVAVRRCGWNDLGTPERVVACLRRERPAPTPRAALGPVAPLELARALRRRAST
jgi:hypothetical protein